MVFLPANFVSVSSFVCLSPILVVSHLSAKNVFSMNIVEINPDGGLETAAHYIAGAFGLTIFATWVVIALQVESSFFPSGSTVWRRVGWPLFYARDLWLSMYHRKFSWKRKTT